MKICFEFKWFGQSLTFVKQTKAPSCCCCGFVHGLRMRFTLISYGITLAIIGGLRVRISFLFYGTTLGNNRRFALATHIRNSRSFIPHSMFVRLYYPPLNLSASFFVLFAIKFVCFCIMPNKVNNQGGERRQNRKKDSRILEEMKKVEEKIKILEKEMVQMEKESDLFAKKENKNH